MNKSNSFGTGERILVVAEIGNNREGNYGITMLDSLGIVNLLGWKRSPLSSNNAGPTRG